MKRFFEQVKIAQTENDFEVRLDDRPVKTPLKTILRLPSKALAQQIADEWSVIETEINPFQMPMFSLAVTAIDSVLPQLSALSSEMQNYIMNDLLCYRELEDIKLQECQSKHWDPWLKWSKTEFNFELKPTKGVMPINQDENNASLLLSLISQMDIWQFTCFVRATTLSGSAILSLALLKKRLNADELFFLCFLDELYQVERWGEDEEALEKRNAIKTELYDVSEFLRLIAI